MSDDNLEIPQEPSLHSLHVMLVSIHKDVKGISKAQAAMITWQKEHEQKDEQRFKDLNKYAASIALVSGAIGAGLAAGGKFLVSLISKGSA